MSKLPPPRMDAERFAQEAGITKEEAERVLQEAAEEKERIDEEFYTVKNMDKEAQYRKLRRQERQLAKKVDYGFAYSTAAIALSIIAIVLALFR